MRHIKRLIKNENTQIEKAEKHLLRLLEEVCQAVDIRIADWDVDKELFIAVISSPSEKLNKSIRLLEKYDECYLLLKTLDISVAAKFRWFTNIKEHVQ